MKESFSELRFVSLVSGGGSTLQEMAHATQEGGELYTIARPVLVIASRPGIKAIERAQDLDIPVEVVNKKDFGNAEDYAEKLLSVLKNSSPDVVTLNGFLIKVPEDVVEEYKGRMFNQHPGPVPEFGGKGMYGIRVHSAILMYCQQINMPNPRTFMTSQEVARDYDMGAVVKSREVHIYPGDTPENLQARALPVEHRLQIELLRDFANGTLTKISQHKFANSEHENKILEQVKAVAIKQYPND